MVGVTGSVDVKAYSAQPSIVSGNSDLKTAPRPEGIQPRQAPAGNSQNTSQRQPEAKDARASNEVQFRQKTEIAQSQSNPARGSVVDLTV